jgi:hypothetical protein
MSKEKKHEMTTLYEIRLVVEQVEDTSDPTVMGYPKTEELDEYSALATKLESKAKLEFKDAKRLLRYLHVENSRSLSKESFVKIGDVFIDSCKRQKFKVGDVRFVLRALIDSFEETVDEGRWK